MKKRPVSISGLVRPACSINTPLVAKQTRYCPFPARGGQPPNWDPLCVHHGDLARRWARSLDDLGNVTIDPKDLEVCHAAMKVLRSREAWLPPLDLPPLPVEVEEAPTAETEEGSSGEES